MNEVVPRITDNLRARLTANGYGEPLTVPFEHRPDCSFGQCWQNVQTTMQREGGSLVIGRIVWQEEHGLWFHLEAHAVWQNPEGRVVDLTPKVDGETEVVFVEDDFKHLGEVVIPSRYIVTSKSLKVRRLVEVFEQRGAIISATLSGSPPQNRDTTEETRRLAVEMTQLAQELFPQDYVRLMRQAQIASTLLMGCRRP